MRVQFSSRRFIYLLHQKQVQIVFLKIHTRTQVQSMCFLDCKYRFDFFKQLIIIDSFVCGGWRLNKSDRVVSCINICYYIIHGGCVVCQLVLNHVHYVG